MEMWLAEMKLRARRRIGEISRELKKAPVVGSETAALPEEQFKTVITEAFKNDIKENGLIEYVTVYDDKILDGRNRYRACTELGITAKCIDYDGDNPFAYVRSKNDHRRHLTASQRAAVAVDALPIYEALAKERQLSTLKQNSTVGTKMSERYKGKSREHASKDFKTSHGYISEVKKIKILPLFHFWNNGIKADPWNTQQKIYRHLLYS